MALASFNDCKNISVMKMFKWQQINKQTRSVYLSKTKQL